MSGAALALETDVALGPFCTYRVGGPARWLVRLERPDQLGALGELTRRLPAAARGAGPAGRDGPADGPRALDLLVIGQGSNLLVADRGFEGLAIVPGAGFADLSIEGAPGDEVRVGVGASARLPVVARRLAAAGVVGFEWAVGVPGSIGGAVRMNAGGHGADLASCLEDVTVADLRHGRVCTVAAAQLQLGYRSSSLRADQLVVGATLRLRRGDPAEAGNRIDEIVAWRRANQPGGPNAGSVFTNPAGDSAGRLIEAAGGKGLRVGTAQVSSRHANFIQVDPGGHADDVRALMVALRDLVAGAGGPELRPETVMVGFPPWPPPAGPPVHGAGARPAGRA